MCSDEIPDLHKRLEEIGITSSRTSRARKIDRQLLALIESHGGNRRQISQEQLRAIRDKTRYDRSPPVDRRLRKILGALNRQGWQCVVPPQTVKPPRPAALPRTPAQDAAAREVQKLERFVRRHWKTYSNDTEGRVFIAALLLVTRCGASDQITVGILSRLRVRDVDTASSVAGRIRTPIHGAAEPDVYHQFVPPRPLKDLLLRQHRRMKAHGGEALLFADAFGTIDLDPPSELERLVRQMLTRNLKQAKKHASDNGLDLDIPKRWPTVSLAGRYLPREYGVPPAILEIFASYPLPKSALDQELHAEASTEPPGALRPDPHSSIYLADQSLGAPNLAGLPAADIPPDEAVGDWSARARILLTRFLKDVENHCTPKHGGKIRPSSGKRAEELLDIALDQADELAPSTRSVLHLALHWLTSKLCTREIAVSSARTYVGRLFPSRLFDQAESLDMICWDDETIDQLTTHLLTNPRWSTKTQQEFLDKWMQFLRYCTDDHVRLLDSGSLPAWNADRMSTEGRPGRRTIITPYQFDHVMQVIDNDPLLNESERLHQKVVVILGFYGGLRASEVLNLTAADLVCSGQECYALVRRTKTPAGRRSVPLHRILPADEMALVMQWIRKRTDDAGKRGLHKELKRASAFGPLVQDRHPTWEEVVAPVVSTLRWALHTDIDYQGLRHCAASWLVLRSYAIYYPEFTKILRHGSHRIFDSSNGIRLQGLFEVFEPHAASNAEKILVHIARVMGHANLRNLALTYAHTLGVIQSHALKVASTWVAHHNRIKP